MFKKILTTAFFFFCLSTLAFAATGGLFVITSNGTGNNISIILCLNVKGKHPLSCQTYITKPGTLRILTTIPNKIYQYAGIRINTPGYAYSTPPEANGYSFIGIVSDTQAATGTIYSTTSSTITPSAGANGSISPNTTQTVAYGGSISFTATPNTGYNVSGWTLDGFAYSACGTNASCELTNVTANHTIAVSFVQQTFTVTPNGDGNETINPDTAQTVAFGSTQTFNVSANTGYALSTSVDGTCPTGTWSGSDYTTGVITSNCSVIFSANFAYTNIYISASSTVDSGYLSTYSANNGATWGYMLSPQLGWSNSTLALAITTDGTLYQASSPSSLSTLIFSSDGVHWSYITTFPSGDGVHALFALGSTIYAGSVNGYVYYSSDQGSTWLPNTPTNIDGTEVNAIVVDENNTWYAATDNNIYYSINLGETWSALPSQPGSLPCSNLAIDSNGTLYALPASNSDIYYNTAPTTTGTWQTMPLSPLLASQTPTSIAASGTTLYVGSVGYIFYTSNYGSTWNENTLPDTTLLAQAMFVSPPAWLSPLFVEAYGVIQITSEIGTGSITVKNLSNMTVNNVQADSSQLPANVTQSSSPCTSVAPQGTCTLSFTANGTKAFAPTSFDIIDGSGNILSQAALVSQITTDGGGNYYYVYNLNGTTAYVTDNTDISMNTVWSPNNQYILGITDNDTISSGSACNGAIDGKCDTQQILDAYPSSTSYPAYNCNISSAGGLSSGNWYLPALCELNGGLYFNETSQSFVTCSGVPTGISSLYSLGKLGGSLNGFMSGAYWSATEDSQDPTDDVWLENFLTNTLQSFTDNKTVGSLANARCVSRITG